MDERTYTIRAHESFDETEFAELFGIAADPGAVILDPAFVLIGRRGEAVHIVFPNNVRLILQANHGG